MRQISRDPFARTTLLREVVQQLQGNERCNWCGQVRTTPSGQRYLYRYGTEPDAIRIVIHWHKGLFCSKSCHDAYHS